MNEHPTKTRDAELLAEHGTARLASSPRADQAWGERRGLVRPERQPEVEEPLRPPVGNQRRLT